MVAGSLEPKEHRTISGIERLLKKTLESKILSQKGKIKIILINVLYVDCEPGNVLNSFNMIPHLVFPASLGGRYSHPHITSEEMGLRASDHTAGKN